MDPKSTHHSGLCSRGRVLLPGLWNSTLRNPWFSPPKSPGSTGGFPGRDLKALEELLEDDAEAQARFRSLATLEEGLRDLGTRTATSFDQTDKVVRMKPGREILPGASRLY
ncbi:MAG: hypothetical protein AAF492_04150 [Verrucomicrobiota bacterium]